MSGYIQVPGFPGYFATAQGQIWSGLSGQIREMRGAMASSGYLKTALQRDGRSHQRYIHRLICEAFHGPAPSRRHVVAHGDGSKTNNAAANLRWATCRQNQIDRRRHKTDGRGERSPTAKLTWADVRDIRQRYHAGFAYQRELAIEYCVSQGCISDIVCRRTWVESVAPSSNTRPTD